MSDEVKRNEGTCPRPILGKRLMILKKPFHNIDFSKVCGILGLHGGEYERNDFVEYWAE
jgi:hypothetical protein